MLALTTAAMFLFTAQKAAPVITDPSPGMLECRAPDGKTALICPLERTDVKAEIVGFGARVTVTQAFRNPTPNPIEALYTFPLPEDAAVDRMTMKIGNRLVQGVIRTREAARAIYEEARRDGKTASLLDQERPNIFTQSVANIMPGARVEIEISYVQLLPFDEGEFTFSFPMVVGPRFTDRRTPDPANVTPPVSATRTGANVSLSLSIDAGVPIESHQSVLHEVEARPDGTNRLAVNLRRKDEIPNRDFIFKYRVTGDQVRSALLTYADPRNGGFFTLILLPPKAPREEDIAPKEVLFVMDQSGSQSGFPIQKSKELTVRLLDTLHPFDTLNVLSFSNRVHLRWPEAVPATRENIALAKQFVMGLEANGGTNLIEAVTGALAPAPDPERRRFVVFNTDGFVGNEYGVLAEVQKHRRNTRMFTFGIGNSVNRFLIDAMSVEGRGASEIVTLVDDADKAVERFVERTRFPLLIDIEAQFEGVEPIDVLPKAIPDVFSETPVVLYGRYSKAGRGTLKLRGKLGQSDWEQTIPLQFPAVSGSFSLEGEEPLEDEPNAQPLRRGSAIATLWARKMVDEVGRRDWMALQSGRKESRAKAEITRLGLAFGLMTPFTSFVAVEQRVVNLGGRQHRVHVPVEIPEGMNFPGGYRANQERFMQTKSMNMPPAMPASGRSGGFGGGGAGNVQYISADPSDNSLVLAPVSKDEFDKLTDAQVVAIAAGLDSKGEAAWLRTLEPRQRERYFLLARVEAQVRSSKDDPLTVAIRMKDVTDAALAALKKAGLTVGLADKNLKTVIGSVRRGELAKIAGVDGVILIRKV